jgi:hypothetical protein
VHALTSARFDQFVRPDRDSLAGRRIRRSESRSAEIFGENT